MNLPHECKRMTSTLVLTMVRAKSLTHVHWYCPQCLESGKATYRNREDAMSPPYDH